MNNIFCPLRVRRGRDVVAQAKSKKHLAADTTTSKNIKLDFDHPQIGIPGPLQAWKF